MENLKKIFSELAGRPVAVLGDLYLDEYIHGKVTNFAEDGPVPIVQSSKRSYQPAAAGYVALLLTNLGCRVHLFGRVGPDLHGQELMRNLAGRSIDCSGILSDNHFSTPNRMRINAQGSHYAEREMIRVINEQTLAPTATIITHFKKQLAKTLPDCRAVIVIDKGTGLICRDILELVRHTKPDVPLIGDSEHHLSLFQNFNVLIANENEAAAALAEADFTADSGDRLCEKLQVRLLFISHGPSGMSVHRKDRPTCFVRTEPRQVFDLVGAGEAVVAAVTAGIVAQADPEEIADFANLTAGVAVSKPGLAEITQEDILDLERQKTAKLEAHKIVSLDQLRNIIMNAKKSGKRVVWTNGCFDIMHVGHILYLEKARSLGDMLVVGLNSDASVRSFKGPARPIVEEKQRAKLISALSCVDYVTIFEDSSPVNLIAALQPDIFAKGGDYSIASLNQDERHAVERYGGRIELLPGVPGLSTSHLIDKIIKTYQ
jgi:D-beta-D-heptose 7-phosphate kinase / D-beta-D-heptose 1-phosphate adenosyltransferase